MGYTRHHAIIVTAYSEKDIKSAHRKAKGIFYKPQVSNICESAINSWYTFTVTPDGSKEGWPQSEAGDDQRHKFISWLNSKRFDDNSSPFDWVEIQYGSDDKITIVVSHSDEIKVI